MRSRCFSWGPTATGARPWLPGTSNLGSSNRCGRGSTYPLTTLEEADAGPVAPPSTRRSRGTNLGPSGPVDHDQADKKARDIGRRGDIEVKSTTGDDPTAPFLISQSELVRKRT